MPAAARRRRALDSKQPGRRRDFAATRRFEFRAICGDVMTFHFETKKKSLVYLFFSSLSLLVVLT